MQVRHGALGATAASQALKQPSAVMTSGREIVGSLIRSHPNDLVPSPAVSIAALAA
jgi:hypothetical protein